MAKETILRLLEVDSVKDSDGNVLEVIEEMRYRYELERNVIAFVSTLPGYNGDESVERVPTQTLEQILEEIVEAFEKDA